MKRIAICIPSGDMVHADFALSLSSLVSFTVSRAKDLQIIAIINERSSLVHKGRNTLVKRAMDVGADKILFLDSDMTFPAITLDALNSTGKDIIGCDCMRRRAPYKNIVKMMNGLYAPYRHEGIEEVLYVGTAVLLVDMDVFKKMGTPYFDTTYDKDADEFIGEDYRFCDISRILGYQVFCDFSMSKAIGHIGSTMLTKEMFAKCEAS